MMHAKVGALCTLLCLLACGKTEPEKSPASPDHSADIASASATATSANADPTAKLRVVKAPADAELASFLRTERLRAKADGRILVVYAGAKWCEPCKVFHMMMTTGRLDTPLNKMVLVELDVDEDTERLGAAGYKYRFVPYFAVVGADGHPVKELQDNGKEVDRTMLATLASWQKDD